MNLKQAIKTALTAVFGILFLVGMVMCVYCLSKGEPHGRYNAEDMKDMYNEGYKNGADNMRQALVKAYTDTTVKTCQQ
jgi:hypothetical protein